MASRMPVDFPRVNLVSILAGALALVSLFLPWWGIDGSGFGFSASLKWSLWSSPTPTDPSSGASELTRILGLASPIILILAIVSAATVLLGSFAPENRLVIGGFVLSLVTSFAYAGIVSYAVAASCQGASTCISGPFGAASMGGTIVSWGFQNGFYLFIVATVILLGAIVFHQAFTRTTLSTNQISTQTVPAGAKFCSNCASPLTSSAKYCSNCAHPVA